MSHAKALLKVSILLIQTGVLVGLMHCSRDETCGVSGTTQQCYCPTGATGSQVCDSSGIWDDCICQPAPTDADTRTTDSVDTVLVADSTDTGTLAESLDPTDSASADIAIDALHQDAPPFALVEPTRLFAIPVGQSLRILGTASYDPDGDAISAYQWTLVSGPNSELQLDGANTPAVTIAPDVAGVYLLELRVNANGVTSLPTEVLVSAVSDLQAHIVSTPPSSPAQMLAEEGGPGFCILANQPLELTCADSASVTTDGVVPLLAAGGGGGGGGTYVGAVAYGGWRSCAGFLPQYGHRFADLRIGDSISFACSVVGQLVNASLSFSEAIVISAETGPDPRLPAVRELWLSDEGPMFDGVEYKLFVRADWPSGTEADPEFHVSIRGRGSEAGCISCGVLSIAVDNGLLGDDVPNDGIYTQTFVADTNNNPECNCELAARFTKRNSFNIPEAYSNALMAQYRVIGASLP